MLLRQLELNNFRGISEYTFDINENNVIIFGENGSGKSSVLHAIELLFYPILNKISNKKSAGKFILEPEDIRFGSSATSIRMNCCINNKIGVYRRYMEKKGNKRTHDLRNLNEIVIDFNSAYMNDDSDNMPIFVSYGVHRLVLDIPLRVRMKHVFDKLSAFESAINSKIDFRTFFEWFRYQEDLENEIKVTIEDIGYTDRQLKAVRYAISSMLSSTKNLRIERHPLAMKIEKNGINLTINQLSDGEKCTIALFGDLGRRLALANPSLPNPCDGKGIVLIDEIELHMHPEWQRRILPTLTKVFPNVQFIVTTHSPQVLGEVGEGFKIYAIQSCMNNFSVRELTRLDGWDSNEILENLMGTSHLNKKTKEDFEKVYDMINNRDFDGAKEVLASLELRVMQNSSKFVHANAFLNLEKMKDAIHKEK